VTGSDAATPRVVRDVPDGRRGFPFSSSVIDLPRHGYIEEELRLEGEAPLYMPVAALGADGRWEVEVADRLAYRTRLLVRRPPPEQFNGTVLVEFMQEYFGTERDTNYRWNAETIVREGFAWVGASLHHEGVDDPGGAEIAFGDMTLRTGPSLAVWDPERYGDLHLPTSDLCHGVLSDVACAVRLPDGALAGLDVRRVIAVGNTIAAVRLQHHINAVHPRTGLFDGYYLQDLTDIGLAFADCVPAPSAWLRTDVDVPVVVLNTTTAALDAVPQPDGDLIRFWEPAGSSHTTGPYMARVAAANKRDLGADTPICPPEIANTFPVQYVSGAALVALHRWVADGESAPTFPRIDVEEVGGERVAVFDDLGNVRGGLRTPWVDVPVARYDWRGHCLGGAGRTYPFTAGELTEIHGTPAEYWSRFGAAAAEAVDARVLLPDDARAAVDAAGGVQW